MDQKRTRLIAIVIAAVAVVTAIVLAGGSVFADVVDRDSETPITGEALERASAAALEYLGEGRVTDTEVGDEDGYYEVEVTLDDGSEVDVHLDETFTVLGRETDEAEDEGADN